MNSQFGNARGLTPRRMAAVRARRGSSKAANCRWNSSTLRCNRTSKGGVASQCRINKKGNCVKSKSAPRRSASSATLAALAKGRDTRASNLRATRKYSSTPISVPSPSPTPRRQAGGALPVCKDMGRGDCNGKSGQLMGCRWSSKGRSRKDGSRPASRCHQTSSGHQTARAPRSPAKSKSRKGKFGARGSACAGLNAGDCGRHPACSYNKGSGKGSGCRRKRQAGGRRSFGRRSFGRRSFGRRSFGRRSFGRRY